jgi:enterochelin esterase-like enzyme
VKPKSLSHACPVLIAGCVFAAGIWAQQSTTVAAGTVEKIKVHGKSLEGNLEGDSPDRDVFVYLPPSYSAQPERRYPVLYFLHGYIVGTEAYWRVLALPETADQAIADGTANEMIFVHPDALTVYGGSMYSNSPTTGNWEAYISQDLVSYIDGHYRTIAARESRGLAGHSMGGYGTVRIGMKHPEVFGALYAMSSCCLMNNPQPGRSTAPAPQKSGDAKSKKGGRMGQALFAQAAAWSPNPMNPPRYFDLPEKDGQFDPVIAGRWAANSPLVMVSQYVPSLKQYRAIAMDVGLQDGLVGVNKELDQSLTRLGVPHTFETYEGNHMNRVQDRYKTKVLPFFSRNLVDSPQGTR